MGNPREKTFKLSLKISLIKLRAAIGEEIRPLLIDIARDIVIATIEDIAEKNIVKGSLRYTLIRHISDEIRV